MTRDDGQQQMIMAQIWQHTTVPIVPSPSVRGLVYGGNLHNGTGKQLPASCRRSPDMDRQCSFSTHFCYVHKKKIALTTKVN